MNEISPISDIDHIIDEIVDIIVSEYKDCPKCGIHKLKKCFSKAKSKKDGLGSNCKDCVKVHNAKRYQENKDEIKAQQAEHRAKPETKAKIAEYNAVYAAKPESKTKRNARRKERQETDEGYRIERNLRNRLYQAMKGEQKSASTLTLVGLESGHQMKEYMDMVLINPELKDVKCDVDHILQCHLYDLTLPAHQKACFHYTNLQWLMPEVNRYQKGRKYPPELQVELEEHKTGQFKFKKDSPTVQKQLELIAHIETRKLTFQQVVEFQRVGTLYKVIGYEIEN